MSLFAAIPLLFSVQQFSEGLVWLALPDEGSFSGGFLSAEFFLVFAQVIWPVWIPFSVYLPERNKFRRRILFALLSASIVLGLYNAVCLFIYTPEITIKDHHINYILGHSTYVGPAATVVYILVSIAPLFISGYAKMKLVGVCTFFALLISVIFYTPYIISVWCYFAAVISVTILLVVDLQKKTMPVRTGTAE